MTDATATATAATTDDPAAPPVVAAARAATTTAPAPAAEAVTVAGAPAAPAPSTPSGPAPAPTGPEAADVPRTDTPLPGAAPAPAAAPAPLAAVPTAPAPAGPADPPVAAQLAPQLTALASRDGSHSVTVVLAPESLGRVEVQLTVTGDQVSLAMSAGQDGSRAVLADAVPELRRELAAAGLQLTDAQVSTGGGQQSGSGWTAGQDPRSTGTRWDAVPTGRTTADEDTSTSSTTRHTRGGPAPSGVDVRV